MAKNLRHQIYMWRKQRSVAKKFGYCHCNPRAFGQFNKGVPSSIWQQCHKLYLTKLVTIDPTTLLFCYRDYFSPKNGEWEKLFSCRVHIQLFTFKTTMKMRDKNVPKRFKLKHISLNHGLIELVITFHM